MADEKEQRDSSVVGKLSSAVTKGQNLQKAYRIAQKARLAVVAAEGGVEALAAAVPIVVFVIILLVIIIVISGAAPSTTVADNPSPSSSTLPTGQNFTCTGDIVSCLKNDFGIVVTGTSDTNILNDIYKIMAIPSQSSTYRSILQKAAPVLHIQVVNMNSCRGAFTSGSYITLNGYNSCGFADRMQFLIHETGHTISGTNNLLNNFKDQNFASKDPSCYTKNGYLKSYPYLAGGPNPSDESFAEALSDNVLYGTPGRSYIGGSVPLPNYPTQCSNTYNWILNNVFGGFVFPQPQPQPPSTTISPGQVDTGQIANHFTFSGATASQQQIIITMFGLPFKSPKYVSLLTSAGPIKINIYPPSIQGALTGGANYDNNTINAWGFFEAPISSQMKQHWLIHESIHLIQRRNGMLGFNLNNLVSQDGSACYDNGWLKTYAYRSDNYPSGVSASSKAHESMAEAAANNAMCAPGASCDFNKIFHSTAIVYPSACSNTYNWIRTNVFGGVDFNGLP